MGLASLVVLLLATTRLTYLFADTSESGPGNILPKFRYWVGVRYNEQSKPYGTNGMAKAILCPFCCSVWFGIFITAGYLLSPNITPFLLLPFALSEAAILLGGNKHRV